MTDAAAKPGLPLATEAVVRSHVDELRGLAGRYGITSLRFASDGRLVGTFADNRDALDVAEFEVAARQLLGAEIGLFSDRVLSKANVSPDLVAAQPL